MKGDTARGKEIVHARVVKLTPIVALDVLYGKMGLVGNEMVEALKMGVSIKLIAQGKIPNQASVIMYHNKIIFVACKAHKKGKSTNRNGLFGMAYK